MFKTLSRCHVELHKEGGAQCAVRAGAQPHAYHRLTQGAGTKRVCQGALHREMPAAARESQEQAALELALKRNHCMIKLRHEREERGSSGGLQ